MKTALAIVFGVMSLWIVWAIGSRPTGPLSPAEEKDACRTLREVLGDKPAAYGPRTKYRKSIIVLANSDKEEK